jgi:hypothetical protein
MVKEIAEYLSLTVWDWLAVTVALCSLFIAILSFIIAKKTLMSQRQTEQNTMPIITLKIQEQLLNDLILRLLDGHIRMTALWYLLNEKKYAQYASEYILAEVKIPQEIIHVDLFYKDQDRYRAVQGLLDMVCNYNYRIEVLNSHLKDQTISSELLYNEFFNLIKLNDRIAETWDKIMTILYNYDIRMKSTIFESLLKEVNKEELNEAKSRYYKEDEIYTRFFADSTQKQYIISFMERKTQILIKEFSAFLIDKN